MSVNLTTADSALKNYYLDAISEQLNKHTHPFLSRIMHTTEYVAGKSVNKVVIAGVNGGIGAGSEDGSLPKSSLNGYLTFKANLKNLYGTIEISDKAIRTSQISSGAVVNLLNSEMNGLIKSGNINLSRMLYGDGSGCLAKITAIENGEITVDTVQNVFEGMILDFYTENGSFCSEYEGRTVTYVDKANNKIKVSGYPEVQDVVNGYVTLQGSSCNELTGFKAIFDTTKSLYGVERSQSNVMIPYVETSATVNFEVIQKAIDEIEEKTGNQVDTIICSLGVRRKLLADMLSEQSNVETVEIEGGYKAILYNGIPVIADRFCPKGTMYLLNSKDFSINQLCDWEWLADDEGRILRQVPGKPVYTATLVKYAELICSNPSGQAMITGIEE